jgi:DNA-damage-inducible protein J
MAQISLRVDDDVKINAEKTFATIGISMSTAINVFLRTVAREKRIPFELTADPFYSDKNMKYLAKIAKDIKTGKAHFAEHDLYKNTPGDV